MSLSPNRFITVFWTLLLAPTLVLAAAGVVLVSNETSRMGQTVLHALEQRAKAVCDTIHITVQTLEDQLTQSLQDMVAADPLPALLAWEAANPLVRHIFVYHPGDGLSYPLKGMASTAGEQKFMNRFERLFSGELAFDFNTSPKQERQPVPVARPEYTSRQNLFSMARSKKAPVPADRLPAGGAAPKAAAVQSPRAGWIPWFSENALCLLGWIEPYPGGPVYGMELETMTLLSRLVTDFPGVRDPGVAMVLTDGSGRILHQSGDLPVESAGPRSVALPVSPLLPHWQMKLYVDPGRFSGSRNMFYLALAVLGLLVTAILVAGFAMTRYALDKVKDAQQKTSFVSAVSHELKTPLTSIRMYAELLLEKRVTDETKKDKYLAVMVGESRRLTRLINNVLDFGRLEQGRKRYRNRSFDLAHFTGELIADNRIRMEKEGLAVHVQMPETPCPVETDRDALSQVLLNLLDNVIKYAGDGRYIRFRLSSGPDDYILSVRDRGPGIPHRHRHAVFDKFYRVDNSLTAARPGSGLGLAISRRIMKDLGGRLVLSSGTQTGCEFNMRIPKP